MLNHLAFSYLRNRLALAAGIVAVMLMAGCGSDDDTATQSGATSTAAATTSADAGRAATSKSAGSASATATSSAPASKAKTRNCPVTAQEVSQWAGLKLHSVPPLFGTKVSCSFAAADKCPCGSEKYPEFFVIIAADLPQSVADQRARSKNLAASDSDGTKLIDRPDLGKDAFVLRPAGQRGRGAVFPSSDGAATVSVSMGVPDKSSQASAVQDGRVSNRVISHVADSMR